MELNIMPKKNSEDVLRYRMGTAGFVMIWRNHIANPQADDWKKFVLACFERFSRERYNMDTLTTTDPLWPTKWQDDDKYEFLSERCYSKCMTIRTKLRKAKDYDVSLPEGYLSRTGRKKAARISITGIMDIFDGKDI
jgi:hypothetical protein